VKDSPPRLYLKQSVSDCSTILLPPPVETGFRDRDARFGFDFHGTLLELRGPVKEREPDLHPVLNFSMS